MTQSFANFSVSTVRWNVEQKCLTIRQTLPIFRMEAEKKNKKQKKLFLNLPETEKASPVKQLDGLDQLLRADGGCLGQYLLVLEIGNCGLSIAVW